MPPVIRKALKEIGLSDKESAVLLVLIEKGPLYAAAIAKAAKLNRTTAYGILKELSSKGLVSQIKRDGADQWQSIAPELLPGYIERRRDALTESSKAVENALPQIKLLRTKGKALPKVQFFEGVDGLKQAYEDTLENNKEKRLRDITGIDAAFNLFDAAWIEYYLKKRAKLGVQCVDLVPDTDWGHKSKLDDEKYIRTTKFLPREHGFDAEVSIYDNKVGIFSYAENNPVAILIEDDTISHMMKTLFDFMAKNAT